VVFRVVGGLGGLWVALRGAGRLKESRMASAQGIVGGLGRSLVAMRGCGQTRRAVGVQGGLWVATGDLIFTTSIALIATNLPQ
jgi:hypothetical protein